jgi:tetratricopeptide (TPR) repeat protein
MKTARLAFVLLLAAGLAGAVPAADPERARKAKALFFDRQYAEARTAWQAVLQQSRGPEADQAAFWIARASESLGESERAFKEYGAFLARRPADKALVEEARTNRVGLAAQLYKAGQRQHLELIYAGLDDPARTVRYYAAFQLASLGPDPGKRAIPVLRRIIEEERDEDLVDRAKLYLIKLDPQSLSRIAPRVSAEGHVSPPRAEGRMLRVRIFKEGLPRPKVTVNLPMTLADLLFKSLPEDAKRDLRRKGYDADNFWDQLKKLGPTEIIHIEGDAGEKIQIWIE